MTTISSAPTQGPVFGPPSTDPIRIEPREPLEQPQPTPWGVPAAGIGLGGLFGGTAGLGIGAVMGSVMDSMNGPLGARGTVLASTLAIGALGVFGGAAAGYAWLTSSFEDFERDRIREEVGRSPLDYAGELVGKFDRDGDGAISLTPVHVGGKERSELRAYLRGPESGQTAYRTYDASELFRAADSGPKDGKLDRRELAHHLARKFDGDGDGVLRAPDLERVDSTIPYSDF